MKYDYTKSNKKNILSGVKKIKNNINKYSKYNSSDLKKLTESFKKQIADRQKDGKSIDDIIENAIAVCYCATKEALGIEFYDTQLQAALAMKNDVIAQMKTGEGKTFVQIIVGYLNYLKSGNVHIVTSNDYLAQRDMEENSKVYNLLGLSCGCVLSDYQEEFKKLGLKKNTKEYKERELTTKQQAYNSDIVYATANTLGFDYLNDHLVYDRNKMVNHKGQKSLIVDEADSVLLDGATTPLIISSSKNTLVFKKEIYQYMNDIVNKCLKNCKLKIYAKEKPYDNVSIEEMEDDIALFFDTQNIRIKDNVIKDIEKLALKDIDKYLEFDIDKDNDLPVLLYNITEQLILAKKYYKPDEHYTISFDNNLGKYKVVLIDQNTGRTLNNSKYNDGLQQAIEAHQNQEYLLSNKPGVNLSNFTNMNSKISFPGFVNLYDSRCGMTGTSDIEEFNSLYNFDTYIVPTNRPNIRIDEGLSVYKSAKDKYNAIVQEAKKIHQTGRPILIGTTSVKESEELSKIFNKYGLRHSLLNAKVESKKEAMIVSTAGLFGSITIATNMAGRGTDIKLGEGVKELGGLYVIGSSINESERIDRQLAGRSGRQGDPGQSKFFASFEDDIAVKYMPNKTINFIKSLDISSKLSDIYSKGLLLAQKVLNGKKQNSRFNNNEKERLVSYQMKEVYRVRDEIINSNESFEFIKNCIDSYVDEHVSKFESADVIKSQLSHMIDVNNIDNIDNIRSALKQKLNSQIVKNNNLDKMVILKCLDDYWNTQMYMLDELKKSVNFSAHEGKDPKEEYLYKGMRLFHEMKEGFFNEIITYALDSDLIYPNYNRKTADVDLKVKKC